MIENIAQVHIIFYYINLYITYITIFKVNPSKSQQKGKRGKTKHPGVKKQATVRKAEKGKGKDYGWLDFLGLPKMKLPDFLDFSSESKKAPRASDAAPQSGGEKVFTNLIDKLRTAMQSPIAVQVVLILKPL